MALQQKYSIALYGIIIFLFFSSPAIANKTVYGYLEPVTLHPEKVSLTAKLDTGAETASISAANIQLYKKGENDYVKFEVAHPKIEQSLKYDLPLVRLSKIKKRASEIDGMKKNHARPVVNMQIYFDGKPYQINVNLIDRSHFSTPMLLGRKALTKLGVIVDGTIKNTIQKNQPMHNN